MKFIETFGILMMIVGLVWMLLFFSYILLFLGLIIFNVILAAACLFMLIKIIEIANLK